MPAAEAGPVTAAEAAKLFAPLGAHARLALAVSGGADSTALLFLMQRWRKALADGPVLSVLSVDHGLRSGARAEAEAVVRLAERYGLSGRLLVWQGEKPQSGIQQAAREARLDLLTEAARETGADAVALAHTADDQAETVLMRLARGSGLDGLAAMAPVSWRGETRLVRPLLDIGHERLVATLEAEGLTWFEDPSNQNIDFERIRLRRLLGDLAGAGIGVAALARSAMRLARARAALDHVTDRAFERLVTVHPEGFMEIDRPGFAAEAEEVRVRLLARAVAVAGGHAGEAARLSAVEAMAAWLAGDEGRARTLAGARIVRRQATILIGREPGRLAVQPVQLGRRDVLWDGRFVIRRQAAGGEAGAGIEIVPGKALGDEVLRLAGEGAALPRFVIDTRPVAIAGGAPLGFAGSAGQGIEAVYVGQWSQRHANCA